MTESTIKKSRWFWAWQDDREESWLESMARQGLHLVSAAPFGQYFFIQGEPLNVVYRLDFVPANRKDESYFQLFRDAGWEHVGELMGWQYWRKQVGTGESSDIFTDVESKARKYRLLLGWLAIIFLPVVMGLINMSHRSFALLEEGGWIGWLFTALQFLLFILFILYIYIFIHIGMRIRQLKHLKID